MTDEPTKNPSEEPTDGTDQPTSPTPSPPPSQPSGVGFASINLPGQQPPSQPLPGQAPGYANPYQPPQTPQGIPPAASAPPPPSPPPGPQGPVYQYDYSRLPVTRATGPSMLLVGGICFLLVLVVGVGALYALGVGPFARPTPRPTPTLVAQTTPTAGSVTPRPTASGAATPVASPTGPAASATPVGDVKAALLSHVPEDIQDSCFVSAPDDSSTIVALAVCSADDGNIALTYFQYDSHDSMMLPYNGYRLASQIEPDSGDCNDHSTWPAEAEFNIGDEPAGRWLCTEELGQTTIYWTDDRLNILSQATQTEIDYERLLDFWYHESGPDL
ncbi:MAG TPA: hypothetical protein VM284_01220 [Candidatus Limnocylindria bacterium]|nr:hypothetical protein [Candidatus Limnocylindria bacterium]